MIRNLLFAGLTLLISVTVSAQCMDWVNPSPTSGYLTFGDVPCTGQSREISYGVEKSEAYILSNIQIGDNLTFSMCEGANAGAWIPEFTVVTPSGEVDNYGAGDGDGCSITWTATEAGIYQIIINETGSCGVGSSDQNGRGKITTNSGGMDCPELLEGAESFESPEFILPECWQAVDADGDGSGWGIETNGDGDLGLDGANAIASYSHTSATGALTPDNYLITPQVTLGENEVLYYAVRSLHHNYSEEEYSIMVSTTGSDVADFTDIVFDDILLYVNEWQARTVDLSAYNNQTIYLAFRHHGTTDLKGLMIDAVKLPGTVNCGTTTDEPCMEWASPSSSNGYLTFGDVPCTGQSRQISYGVEKSEAYILSNIQVGDNLTFSMCEGDNVGAWIPEFTVVAPSGAVDNFGAGDGDGCSITWTATEAGIYQIIINEAGNCGVGSDEENGQGKITTNSGGMDCPEMMEGAESFESPEGILPECWQAVDADGDGFGWTIVTLDEGDPVMDGANAIESRSYISGEGALTPDNYLITPQVTLGSNESLYYAVRSLRHKYSEEEYSILVSTTGSDVGDFTDVVFVDTLQYVNEWQARTIGLSTYANQTIYLAFRHHGTSDLYGFMIDAVKLPGVVNCSPDAVTELDKVESNLFPNPATDKVTITSSLQGAATVRVYDAIGRVVLMNNVHLSQAAYTQNISSLNRGIYTIQISTTDQVATQRFVKQ